MSSRVVFYIILILCSLNLNTSFGQSEIIDSLLMPESLIISNEEIDFNQLANLQKALNISKENNHYRVVDVCIALGDVFFEFGLYTDAINYYRYGIKAKPLINEQQNKIIKLHRKIGQSYSSQGDTKLAFENYNLILKLTDYPEQLVLYRELVEICSQNADFEKSLEYNLRIQEMLIQNKASESELSKIHNNIGYNYFKLEEYQKSINYFTAALTSRSDFLEEDKLSIERNLGISFYNLGQINESIETLKKVLNTSSSDEVKGEVAYLMAQIFNASKDYLRAIFYYEQAKEFIEKTNKPELLGSIYSELAKVYNDTHDYDLAIKYYKANSIIRDSLKFIEQLNQKRLLDNQQFIERTEKENRLLKAQQDFQALQFSQLETQSRNQLLINEALRADSIQAANELDLARQQNLIAKANEENGLLEIARQKNLLQLKNKALELAKTNEVNARIEGEKQSKENELAVERMSLQERNAQLQTERSDNRLQQIEILKRKTGQRNTAIFAALLALLAGLMIWAYRNKRKDNDRISEAYDNITIAQSKLKAAESKIKGLLKQQVSGAIAESLMSNIDPSAVEQRFVSIMFLDIRNFTGYCEGKKPEEIIAYQNSIFGFIINIVEKHNGVVNQLLGDGFMATFGAPVTTGNDCHNAYLAALEIIGTLKEKVDNKEVYPTEVGIGLHAGNVVTGNVGNEERKQFSITGNTVILAARLEQLNKEYGSNLVYSKELYQELPDSERQDVSFRSVFVKGRKKAIEITTV